MHDRASRKSEHDEYLANVVCPDLQGLGLRVVDGRAYHDVMSGEDAVRLARMKDRTSQAEKTRADKLVIGDRASIWADAKVIGSGSRHKNYFVESFGFFNSIHKSLAGQRTVHFCSWPGEKLELACIVDRRLAGLVSGYWRFVGQADRQVWAEEMFDRHCDAYVVIRTGGGGSGTDAVRIDYHDVLDSELFFDWRLDPGRLFEGLE